MHIPRGQVQSGLQRRCLAALQASHHTQLQTERFIKQGRTDWRALLTAASAAA